MTRAGMTRARIVGRLALLLALLVPGVAPAQERAAPARLAQPAASAAAATTPAPARARVPPRRPNPPRLPTARRAGTQTQAAISPAPVSIAHSSRADLAPMPNRDIEAPPEPFTRRRTATLEPALIQPYERRRGFTFEREYSPDRAERRFNEMAPGARLRITLD